MGGVAKYVMDPTGGILSVFGNKIGDIVGGITGANQQADAAQQASIIQANSANAGIEEQRRQFDKLVEIMAPYVTAGENALPQMTALAGGGSPGEERAAIAAIQASPEYQSLIRNGEEAMLQHASATGGLRGGNIQGAMAQYRPQILADLINSRYARLGKIAGLGQASATGQAEAGLNTGTNIANLYGQQGSALAGGQIAAGGKTRQGFNDLMNIGGTVAGALL